MIVKLLLVAWAVSLCPAAVQASYGDTSIAFLTCIHRCFFGNCSTTTDLERFTQEQAWYLKATLWECEDECSHECMWETVEFFDKMDMKVQFRGKWPFHRWYGIQEPASALFSILNGMAHVCGWSEFKKRIAPSNKYYSLWRAQAFLAMNAWFWSTVFHTRDIEFTEKMDYFSAYSIVLFSLYALFARVALNRFEGATHYILVPFALGFLYHVNYMLNTHFDYSYHLKLSVATAILNSIGWLYWCYHEWPHRPYVNKCLFVVVSLLVLSSLEIADFSPIWFIFDAHSLWHLGTAPLPLVWYRFLIDDCRFESGRSSKTLCKNGSRKPSLMGDPSSASGFLGRRGLLKLKEILKGLSVFPLKNEGPFLIDQ